MRRDMFKVIVERPRYHPPGGKTRGRLPRDPDDAPSREGIRRRYNIYARKNLSDNLAPLRRYLVKQVGRPWDKVLSEICQTLRLDSTVQRHVREHIADFVSFAGPTWLRPLYVDSRTGLLRLSKRKR